MDASMEKKWFIYIGDHHEGPFSVAEIGQKLRDKVVEATSFVWCDGMADWKAMNEITDFSDELSPQSPGSQPEPQEITAADAIVLTPRAEAESHAEIEAEEPRPEVHAGPATPPATFPGTESNEPLPTLPGYGNEPWGEGEAPPPAAAFGVEEPQAPSRRSGGRALRLVAVALLPVGAVVAFTQGWLDPVLSSGPVQVLQQVVGDAVRPMTLKYGTQFPFLSNLVSPVPALEDIEPSELEGLRLAASAPLSQGPKLEVAFSKEDPLAPQFHVATNLPDNTFVEVAIVGMSDTLLNASSFMGMARGTVSQRMAKIGPIRPRDGRAVPRGMYQVFAFELDQQPAEVSQLLSSLPFSHLHVPTEVASARKLIAYKTYFLGGPKDQLYTERLKEYHDKLKQTAERELSELRQLRATLEVAMNESMAKHAALRASHNKAARNKVWGAFHENWMKREQQLAQSYQKWSPERKGEYFYGVLYQYLQTYGLAVAKMHGLQHAFYTASGDPKAQEAQITEAQGLAQGAHQVLKTKIDQAQAMPATPAGLPRREGL